MHLVGYVEPLVARAGSRFGFHISTDLPDFQVDFVRLRHGDRNPRGPGFRETVVPAFPAFIGNGKVQPITLGSYAIADALPAGCPDSWPIILPGNGPFLYRD